MGERHEEPGGGGPDAEQAARDLEQELRDRGQELRDRGRELRELGRELARAQRVAARGLRGTGHRGTGSAGAGSDGKVAGAERSTRERVLDVALDVFIEQGYDKASLREIAERMGFTKAALYYHFPSKADMLLALHQRMHGLIDEHISLLGEGTVTLPMWETFLDACISTLKDNQKIFQMHRINQSALAGLHSEGHEGEHQELEERARRIFSEPSVSPADRLRMAAAFAVAFLTPFMTVDLFSDSADDFMPNGLREIVHQVLQPAAAKLEAEPEAAEAKREAENLPQ